MKNIILKLRLKFLLEQWKKFAFKFREFMSGVILTIFYFIIVTPHAIVLKLFLDPLEIKKSAKETHWHMRKSTIESIGNISKQY
ncbi:MAG: hypothetical protein A3I11_04245 [Elusimicrobia bacterium RIFCSPLOWO2_02_FULL_39_32]|nr:MAG: hypothetical protein A2034_06575 [Elusimicrobia bacterium GWA2_38_7]OGR79583.1 MAG: hypothetical protein A3B80_02820 [Elusimicrobia bacterium RIFCSPHIGHO2_02_FULL_39_36]OGR92909.1 MAG: hypothetical protein A3I11_04245 [Elusimicrobia bacterium RIFCSPLOWO2_02_FULL_39_32]OGR99693.1 MAG: hypothetical protein A3G85_01610 [Elusimicrobia bacterium RIFCSPLOWO2_12_FULL_39_28]